VRRKQAYHEYLGAPLKQLSSAEIIIMSLATETLVEKIAKIKSAAKSGQLNSYSAAKTIGDQPQVPASWGPAMRV
jgi:hypothetical protein